MVTESPRREKRIQHLPLGHHVGPSHVSTAERNRPHRGPQRTDEQMRGPPLQQAGGERQGAVEDRGNDSLCLHGEELSPELGLEGRTGSSGWKPRGGKGSASRGYRSPGAQKSCGRLCFSLPGTLPPLGYHHPNFRLKF